MENSSSRAITLSIRKRGRAVKKAQPPQLQSEERAEVEERVRNGVKCSKLHLSSGELVICTIRERTAEKTCARPLLGNGSRAAMEVHRIPAIADRQGTIIRRRQQIPLVSGNVTRGDKSSHWRRRLSRPEDRG